MALKINATRTRTTLLRVHLWFLNQLFLFSLMTSCNLFPSDPRLPTQQTTSPHDSLRKQDHIRLPSAFVHHTHTFVYIHLLPFLFLCYNRRHVTAQISTLPPALAVHFIYSNTFRVLSLSYTYRFSILSFLAILQQQQEPL